MQMIRMYLVWQMKRFVRWHCKNGQMHAHNRNMFSVRYALKKADRDDDGNGNENDIFIHLNLNLNTLTQTNRNKKSFMDCSNFNIRLYEH